MLKAKKVALDTEPENTVFLSRNCGPYRAEEFTALRKVEIASGNRSILATLIISDDTRIVGNDELGLGNQAFRRLKIEEGTPVQIAQAAPPRSLEAVRAKVAGEEMASEQIDAIIDDIASFRYAPMEIAAFLVSSARFMTTREVLALTKAMTNAGERLHWNADIVVDKHCIGGIPGNRTSMIVAPIVAAYGLQMPKTSSRAITSPSGTADTMEVLCRVDLTAQEMRDVVEKHNACLIWGGHVNLSPADDVLISVERPLRIDMREQMVASILSKKLAAGSTHLLLDIPVGPSAKVRTQNEAVRLRKLFEYTADQTGLVLNTIFSDGSQPVGRGIGPVLEARDVMQVLRGDPNAPQDLRESALTIAGHLLEFDPGLRGGTGREVAGETLESGAALAAMEQIIAAQGPPPRKYEIGNLTFDMCAQQSGIVASMDCFRLARIARLAGAPMDKGAGIDLFAKIGDHVSAGDPLYRVHSCFKSDFEFAENLAREDCGVVVSDRSEVMGNTQ